MDDDLIVKDHSPLASAVSDGFDHADSSGDVSVAELDPTAPADTDDLVTEDAVAPEAEDDGRDIAPVIEALLFASDTAISAGRLAELVGAGTPHVVRQQIDLLNEKYEACNLSFRIEKLAGGYQMLTLPDYQPWLVKLNKQRSQTRLSNAAMETLSIIAYKQPIIRAQIETIRGVACGDSLNRLREMGLIKITGRADMVGRPMLYGTTKKFLDVFGLASLDDLPPLETLTLRRGPEPEEADDASAESEPPAAASA